MINIGSGVQYDVYDIGNNRVRKIESSFFQKIYRFHKIAPKYKIYRHPLHNIKTSIEAAKITRQSINGLKDSYKKIDLVLLGNPILINDSNYEQDFVSVFEDVLYASDFEQQKVLIDEYLNNLLSCWDYGFSDTNFNFTVNCGVTRDGKVILIDLGELSWDKNFVRGLVEERHWEMRSSYNRLRDEKLKDYVRNLFRKEATVSTFKNRWGSKFR